MSNNLEHSTIESCQVCAYIVAYGEYNDGEDTVEVKTAAWESRGWAEDIRWMSVGDPTWVYSCDLCGDVARMDGETIHILKPK